MGGHWAGHRAGAPLSGETGGAAIVRQWRPTSLSQAADADDGPRRESPPSQSSPGLNSLLGRFIPITPFDIWYL